MKKFMVFAILLLLSTGCDLLKKEKDDETPKSQDTATEEVNGTESETDSESSAGEQFSDLTAIPPLQVSGNALEEIATLLEAKRLSLEQKERDLIQREQMITRLESEALSQKLELENLQADTQSALNDAKTELLKQYEKEHRKLLNHWDKIKEKHKEFIVNHLNYSESENKEKLEPEIQRLRQERKQRIDQLLKTIEGMNPQSCAMMITSMPLEDAIEVLSGLSSTKTAEILSNTSPQKSAELARGLMGPKVPTIPELEDVALPAAPKVQNDPDGKQGGGQSGGQK